MRFQYVYIAVCLATLVLSGKANAMDDAQKKYIKKNLSELRKETICSEDFLDYFLEAKILTAKEVKNIQFSPDEAWKADNLYGILQKKAGAYSVLVHGLDSTGQKNAWRIAVGGPSLKENNEL